MNKLFLFFLIFLIGCSTQPYVKISGKSITVEVADEPREMLNGLMHRESLCENCGMIFVFLEETEQDFWMKDTLIPLDMIFIDGNNLIVDVISAEPCKKDPCEHYIPNGKAKYVVEVNHGTFDENIIGKNVSINI